MMAAVADPAGLRPVHWCAADLERLRDRRWRRLPGLRVSGPVRALRFLNEVGLASLFATRGLNVACLWVAVCGRRDPEFPLHSHHDPEVGLAWNLKDRLPADGKVFYGKLIRGKPTFVAWDVFPSLYRLRGPLRDYRTEYRHGLLSPGAKIILDALHQRRPQETFELKRHANLARPSQRRVFDAAMAELQRKLYVSMSEVRYDPFTYVWDLVEARFPERIAAAKGLDVENAALLVGRRYMNGVVFASPHDLRNVIGDRIGLRSVVGALEKSAAIAGEQRIDGLAGRWLISRGLHR